MRVGALDGSIEPSPAGGLEGVNVYPPSTQIAVVAGTTGAVVALLVAVSLAMRCMACVRRRRGGSDTNYVPFDDTGLDGDEVLPARLSMKALPGGMSQKSSDTLSSTRVSVASLDSAIEAPEIANHETVGGSGVGFLDERGVPIVLTHNIVDEELDDEGDYREETFFGDDDYR